MGILNVSGCCPILNVCLSIDACYPGRWCWLLKVTPQVKSRVTSCEVAIGQVTKVDAEIRGFFAFPLSIIIPRLLRSNLSPPHEMSP